MLSAILVVCPRLIIIAHIVLTETIALPLSGARLLAALLILLTIDTLLPVLILPTRAALTTNVATVLAGLVATLAALAALAASLLVLLTVETLLPILVLPALILAHLAALVLITHRPSPVLMVLRLNAKK